MNLVFQPEFSLHGYGILGLVGFDALRLFSAYLLFEFGYLGVLVFVFGYFVDLLVLVDFICLVCCKTEIWRDLAGLGFGCLDRFFGLLGLVVDYVCGFAVCRFGCFRCE